MNETGHGNERTLRVLMLADFLPDPASLDPWLRSKNVFVQRQALKVSERHPMDCPVLVPRLPGLVKAYYKLRGHTVRFPTPRAGRDGGITLHTLRYNHVPRRFIQSKTDSLLEFARSRPYSYDLIHCHTMYDLGVCGLALKEALGIPLVVTAYGTDINWLFEEDPSRKAGEEITRATIKILAGADAAIGVSRDLCRKMEQLGVDPAKVHWAPNGVDPELFSPGDKATERTNLGWESNKKTVLYVGNILETKGLGELVEAVALLRERDKAGNLVVKLAGPDGGYQNTLLDKIGRAGLGEHFQLLGRVDHAQVASLMRASDLFCLPSWREGWPNVVTEAMACGTPVVATTVGGIVEMLQSGAAGMLVPPREAAPLADALQAALEKDWDSGEITRAAEPYWYERVAERIGIIYQKIRKEAGKQN